MLKRNVLSTQSCFSRFQATIQPTTKRCLHTHQHNNNDWLLPFVNTPELSDFVSILVNNAKIEQMAFIRHGNTGPADVDFQRTLTPLGQDQARASGTTFGKQKLLPLYPKILFSPAPRTVETAQLFVHAAIIEHDDEDRSLLRWISIPCAYDGTMQPGGNALFRKIGYAPLSAYCYTETSPDDQVLARKLLGQYAHDVILETKRQINDDENNQPNENDWTTSTTAEKPTTLLFFGHAIYLSALALGVATLVGCNESGQKLIMETFTQEAEGFLVNFSTCQVEYLSREM